jgi:hypothetical protein
MCCESQLGHFSFIEVEEYYLENYHSLYWVILSNNSYKAFYKLQSTIQIRVL